MVSEIVSVGTKGETMIDGLLDQVDPLICSTARRYQDSVLSYLDHEDLVQEGKLAAFQAIKYWMSKKPEASASMFSWVFVCVNNRFKELAKKAKQEIALNPYRDEAYTTYQKPAQREIKRLPCNRHGDNSNSGDYLSEISEEDAINYALGYSLTRRDVALLIQRTPERVAQLQKKTVRRFQTLWTRKEVNK